MNKPRSLLLTLVPLIAVTGLYTFVSRETTGSLEIPKYQDADKGARNQNREESLKENVRVQAFLEAAAKGDVTTTLALLDQGVDVNSRDRWGKTVLIHAAVQGQLEVVRLLLDRGADVNAAAPDGKTALLQVVEWYGPEKPRADVLRLLIARGANVNARSKQGESALEIAVRRRRMEMIKTLVAAGAEGKEKMDRIFDEAALLEAAGKGDMAIVRVLLDRGANVNAKGEYGVTVLIRGAGHIDIVKLLLDRGADVNAKMDEGYTPLFYASNAEIVRLLVAKGADVNATADNNLTPLLYATWYRNDVSLVQTLISQGATVEARDMYGETALMRAANRGYTEVVKALIAGGADVNAKSAQSGSTALMAPAANGRAAAVEALLAAGADVNARRKGGWTALLVTAGAAISPPGNKMEGNDPERNYNHEAVVEALLAAKADVAARTEENGETALILASGEGNTKIVGTLLAAGVEVNAQANDGSTALMRAAYWGHTEIAKILLAAKADVKIQNKEGQTALSIATRQGKTAVVALLKKGGAIQ
jgi:ankyrin repeat protein